MLHVAPCSKRHPRNASCTGEEEVDRRNDGRSDPRRAQSHRSAKRTLLFLQQQSDRPHAAHHRIETRRSDPGSAQPCVRRYALRLPDRRQTGAYFEKRGCTEIRRTAENPRTGHRFERGPDRRCHRRQHAHAPRHGDRFRRALRTDGFRPDGGADLQLYRVQNQSTSGIECRRGPSGRGHRSRGRRGRRLRHGQARESHRLSRHDRYAGKGQPTHHQHRAGDVQHPGRVDQPEQRQTRSRRRHDPHPRRQYAQQRQSARAARRRGIRHQRNQSGRHRIDLRAERRFGGHLRFESLERRDSHHHEKGRQRRSGNQLSGQFRRTIRHLPPRPDRRSDPLHAFAQSGRNQFGQSALGSLLFRSRHQGVSGGHENQSRRLPCDQLVRHLPQTGLRPPTRSAHLGRNRTARLQHGRRLHEAGRRIHRQRLGRPDFDGSETRHPAQQIHQARRIALRKHASLHGAGIRHEQGDGRHDACHSDHVRLP